MGARLLTRSALLAAVLTLVPWGAAYAQGSWHPIPVPGWGQGTSHYAFDRGFREGYEEGERAGRRGEVFDPYREKDYRRADQGYSRRLGPREAYKWEFRQGFEAGYARGFRDGRRPSRYTPWGWRRWP